MNKIGKTDLVEGIWMDNIDSKVYERWVEMRYVREEVMDRDPQADEFFIVLEINDFYHYQPKDYQKMCINSMSNPVMHAQFQKGMVAAYMQESSNEEGIMHNPEIEKRIENYIKTKETKEMERR